MVENGNIRVFFCRIVLGFLVVWALVLVLVARIAFVLFAGVKFGAVYSFYVFPQRTWICVSLCAAWRFADIWFL